MEEAAVAKQPWAGSTRKARLPADWPARRLAALKRDNYECQWRVLTPEGGKVLCGEPATDADHRIPGDDHSLENLQSLCGVHHGRKSGGEGGRAAAQRRAEVRQRFRRAPEVHPAYLANR